VYIARGLELPGQVVGRRLVLGLVHHRLRRPTHKIRTDYAETS
jgi:hypothetical protein